MLVIRSLILALPFVLAIQILPPPVHAQSQLLDFENLDTGGPGGAGALLAVFRQYADRGIVFNRPLAIDYSKGPFAIPAFAHSGTKAIETCVGEEFCQSPIEMTFTTPQTHVKMVVGYSAPLSQAVSIVLKAFDGTGNLVGTTTSPLSQSGTAQPIRLPVEVTAPTPSMIRLTVSLLASGPAAFNNWLALDDIEFDATGPPPACVAMQPPLVSVDSPTGATVYRDEFNLEGTIITADQLEAVTLIATSSAGETRTADILSSGLVRPMGGSFGPVRFSGLLFPGQNTVTVSARNCRGTGQSSGNVLLVVPTSPRVFASEVNQGIPSYALVAGKTTLVRVYVGASAPGAATRITHSSLDVTRSNGTSFTIGADVPREIFTNTTQQYSENDNVNFYIPGDLLEPDSYRFAARLYDGIQLLTTVNLPGNPYAFARTRDISLLVVLPDIVEYGRPLAEWATLADYLSDIARVYPVRDGWGLPGDDAGLQVSLRLYEPVCNGSFPPQYANCGPTESEVNSDPWASLKWKLVQPRLEGQLRTLLSSFTTSSSACPGRNARSYLGDGTGGLATQLVPDAFLYFPGWLPNTADPAFDLNYNGQLDVTDLAPYVSEYFNTRSGAWSTDLTQLRAGDIVHSFVDNNRDCTFTPGEVVSPLAVLPGKLVPWMYQKVRALADASNIPYAAYVVWPGMDRQGTGGGTASGQNLWAVLAAWPAFHQELGHTFGMVSSSSPNWDGGSHSINLTIGDSRTFDILRKRALLNPISVMAGLLGTPYNNSLLEPFEYNQVWGQLRTAMRQSSASNGGAGKGIGSQFLLHAYIDRQDNLQVLSSSAAENLPVTPKSEKSAYSIAFLGPNKKVLGQDRLAAPFSHVEREHHEKGPPENSAFLRIVRPLPPGTVAVEVRHDRKVLCHIDRPHHVAAVTIDSVRLERGTSKGRHEESLALSWTGMHPDGAKLTYSVFYSSDSASAWQCIGTGITTPHLRWSLSGTPGSERPLVRVDASDGFNVTKAITQGPAVAPKPPLVALFEPEVRAQRVLLRGSAFDLQDGVLSGASLVWTSDTDGRIGSGETLECYLTPGSHAITLQTTNSWGLAARTQATFVVPRRATDEARGSVAASRTAKAVARPRKEGAGP